MEELKVLDHKCLLYWHRKSMGSLPLPDGKRLTLFPGYNAFDYSALDGKCGIYNQCKDLIDNGFITFEFVTVRETEKGLKITESGTLSDLTVKELDKILSETYNPDTLNILSDPSIVNAMYSKQAVARKKKLSEAVGTEADNIKEVKENNAESV